MKYLCPCFVALSRACGFYAVKDVRAFGPIASFNQVSQLKFLNHLWRAGPRLSRHELNEFVENAREGAFARGSVKFRCLVGSEQRNHVREKAAAGELGEHALLG